MSCHLCICKKKELAPISSPKSWRFDLKSRPPKWLKWLKWQSKSKGQETSRFKWASKYLIVFFGWFLFSCQTDSKPKCCGGTTHKKKTSPGTFRSMFRGTGEFGFMCEGLHWAVAGQMRAFCGISRNQNHHLELTSAEVAIHLPRTFGSSIYGVRLRTFEPHRFLPHLKTPNTTWSQELLHN